MGCVCYFVEIFYFVEILVSMEKCPIIYLLKQKVFCKKGVLEENVLRNFAKFTGK